MTNEALNQRGITLSGSNSPHYGNCELQSYMTITGNCFNNNTKIYCVILGSNSDTGTRNVTSPIANIIVSGKSIMAATSTVWVKSPRS